MVNTIMDIMDMKSNIPPLIQNAYANGACGSSGSAIGTSISGGTVIGTSIGASGGVFSGMNGGAGGGGGGGGFSITSQPIPQPAPLLSEEIQELVSLGLNLKSNKKTIRDKFKIFLETLSIREVQELLNERDSIINDTERFILLNA